MTPENQSTDVKVKHLDYKCKFRLKFDIHDQNPTQTQT